MRVDIDDVGLFVREFGQGDPVVLVPPGPGLDGSAFFPWFERLEAIACWPLTSSVTACPIQASQRGGRSLIGRPTSSSSLRR